MKTAAALVTIMLWPVIPLMWIPVHLATGFFRGLGRATYLFVAAAWMAAAYLIFLNQDIILAYGFQFHPIVSIVGVFLVAAGTLLHIWTAVLLTVPGIIGIHEITKPQQSRLVDSGPFSVVRHPTYLAHTMIFFGVFLFTGITSVLILTLVDFAVVSTIIIPFEEKELQERLGQSYTEYMKRVPRLMPRGHRRGVLS